MRRLVSLALAAALLATVAPACRNTPTAPDTATAVPMLVARETAKWSLLFGTAPQRDSAVAWYASDFVNVGYGPTGLARSGRTEMAQSLAFFPTLPAGDEVDHVVDRLGQVVEGRHRRNHVSAGIPQLQQVLEVDGRERGLARDDDQLAPLLQLHAGGPVDQVRLGPAHDRPDGRHRARADDHRIGS